MRWLFALLFVLFSATTTAVIVGRLQPLPEPLRSLHLTDCRPPCWIGITPGVTTIEDAKLRIGALYKQFTVYDSSINMSFQTPDRAYGIELWTDNNGLIKAIVFSLERASVPSWQLLSIFGTPSYWVQTGYHQYQLGYVDNVEMMIVQGRFSQTCQNEITFIDLSQGKTSEEIARINYYHRWTGYRSLLQAMDCTGDEIWP